MPQIEQIRALSIPSAARTLLAIAADWLMIALTFLLAIQFPNPFVWVICFLFMARQQLALAILMHDGSHRRLFKSARANDWTGQFLCAAPLFFSMFSYQRLHLKHHRDPMAPDDPDLSLTGGYPIPLSSLLRKIFRDATGLSYFKFIRYFIYMSRQAPKKTGGPKEGAAGGLPLPVVVVSILLMAVVQWSILFALGHGWYFFFFWALPAMTFLQVLLRIRGITEHAGYQQNPDQSLNARTVINPLQTFIFAPHNVNYHIEHHIYPAVPFFNLPRLHRLMMAEGLVPEANIYRGYRQVLKDLIHPT